MSGFKIDALADEIRSRAAELAPDAPGTSCVVREIAAAVGYTERQVWRTVKRFREDGTLPSTGAYELTDDHIEVIYITRGAVETARKHLEMQGVEVPSASTWKRAAERDIGKLTLASLRKGARGIRERQIYLTAEDRPRNHTWQMDHAHLPLRVSLGDGGDPVEVWITSVIDVGTRFLVGWALTIDRPDAASVREALLMGFYGCRGPDGERVGGVPELVVWDRGLEFLSETVVATTDAFRTLGIALPPFSPHRKGKIERWFRTVKAECIDFLLGSTRGPKDLRDKPYNTGETVGLDVLQQRLAEYIDHYNFDRVHSAIRSTPWQAWLHDTTALRAAPKHAVYEAMVRASKPRKVDSRGVTFRGGTYAADALSTCHGLTVEVRYIPNDLNTIEVFREGRHLCTAIEKSAMSAGDREAFLHERTENRFAAQQVRRRMSKRKIERARQHTPIGDVDEIDSLAADGADAFAELLAGFNESEVAQLELL
ncbi:MAG: DDE-type integrase/transposase/recombinase [Actinobacteria bacterium]|jgi:putative transposase|nr:DDE-type integrase/transposase/recombinase [Actinomycetota bacterium]